MSVIFFLSKPTSQMEEKEPEMKKIFTIAILMIICSLSFAYAGSLLDLDHETLFDQMKKEQKKNKYNKKSRMKSTLTLYVNSCEKKIQKKCESEIVTSKTIPIFKPAVFHDTADKIAHEVTGTGQVFDGVLITCLDKKKNLIWGWLKDEPKHDDPCYVGGINHGVCCQK